MKTNHSFVRLVLILLIFPLFIVNCKINEQEMNVTKDIKTLVTLIPTRLIATSSPFQLKTSSPELTYTSKIPLELTRTTTPSITPSYTPVPTLSSEKKFEVFTSLLLENEGCSFPCWWGIKPEETISSELALLSSRIGKSPYIREMNKSKVYDYSLSLDDLQILDLSMSIYSKDDLVQYLIIVLEQPVRLNQYRQALTNLSIKKIFTQYGKPTNIFLAILPPIEPDGKMQYSIYIQYSNFGFSIEYGGVTETTQDINVCTGSLEDTNLQLISLYLGTQIQGIDLNPSYQSNELKNIVDVTDTNIDMLYREVEERGEPFCLITPIDIWN